jgi:hypothetical protein
VPETTIQFNLNHRLFVIFRCLILAFAACQTLLYFLPLIEPELLPVAISKQPELNGFGALLMIPPVVWYSHGIVTLGALCGLYKLAKTARIILVILTIFSLIAAALGGVGVGSAAAVTLGYFAALLQGAVLLMAFLPPLSKEFR